MVKRMTALLLAALLTAMLSGCGAAGVEQTNGQLHLYLAPYDNLWLGETIARYQELYPEVEVVIEDHSTEEYGAGVEAIRAELMAGRGPDLIFRPEYYFDDVEKAMTTGVFAELDPLFEADPDFRREDFYGDVMSAGVYRGRQYVMPLTFNLPLLLTSREALEEADFHTENCGDYLGFAEEVDRYLREGRETKVFNRIQFGMYYPSLLGIDFLGYEERTADFSAPEFARAAELYSRLFPQDMPEVDTGYTGMMGGYTDVAGREALFALYDAMSAYELFLNASAISSRETPVLLPVRAADGKNTALVGNSAAIGARSPNRQNAYDFLKLLLAESWQNGGSVSGDLPMRRSCLEDRIAAAREMTNNQVLDTGDGSTVPLPPLPESFYGEYRAELGNIGHVSFSYGFLPGEVFNYMGAYYRGEKSFETCRKELTESVKIYMSE